MLWPPGWKLLELKLTPLWDTALAKSRLLVRLFFGFYSAAFIIFVVISKAFSFETGLQFVVMRARVLRSDPIHPGGMAAIAASEAVVNRYISEMGLQNRVSIAVYNATDNNVISGDMKAIENMMAAVKRDGIRATKLVVGQGKGFRVSPFSSV